MIWWYIHIFPFVISFFHPFDLKTISYQKSSKISLKKSKEPSSMFQRHQIDALLCSLVQKFPPKVIQQPPTLGSTSTASVPLVSATGSDVKETNAVQLVSVLANLGCNNELSFKIIQFSQNRQEVIYTSDCQVINILASVIQKNKHVYIDGFHVILMFFS